MAFATLCFLFFRARMLTGIFFWFPRHKSEFCKTTNVRLDSCLDVLLHLDTVTDRVTVSLNVTHRVLSPQGGCPVLVPCHVGLTHSSPSHGSPRGKFTAIRGPVLMSCVMTSSHEGFIDTTANCGMYLPISHPI